MAETIRKRITRAILFIVAIVISSIFSGLGYGVIAAVMGVNDFGPLLEQMLFSYFLGGVAAALYLSKKIHILWTMVGSILAAILTTIVVSLTAYDFLVGFSNFAWDLSGDSIPVAFLNMSIISFLVSGSLIGLSRLFGGSK